jgi:hypothetical protein
MKLIEQVEATTPPGPKEEPFGVKYNPECHGTDGLIQAGYNDYHYPQNSSSHQPFHQSRSERLT